MPLYRLFRSLVLAACWTLLLTADVSVSQSLPKLTTSAGNNNNSTTAGRNNTGSDVKPKDVSVLNAFHVDSYMIQRALYVLIGITLIGLLYFLVRAVRLKKPAPKKKYGLLSNYDDSVEMEGVDSEEDDTLYEARSLRR